jgi:hypothetical protein
MTIAHRPTLGLTLVLMTTVVLAACSAGAAPANPSPSDAPPPSSAPPASGGGSDQGSGALPPDSPIVGEPPIGGGDPGSGQPSPVVPRPGTINPRPVAIMQLLAQVSGRHVVVNARWWSGVEPCYVLDSATAKRSGNTFTITLLEGSAKADAICIEIAMEKVTVIDLGELEPGTYIIEAAHGDAASITVEVG